MTDFLYPLAAIGVIGLVTYGLRAAPFLLFGGRPLPKIVQYLGKVLPPAIMTALVIYCLRSTDFTQTPFGVPELAACAVTAALQILKKNMYLSILAGTACCMLLLRVFGT